jgi:hypothetical protein
VAGQLFRHDVAEGLTDSKGFLAVHAATVWALVLIDKDTSVNRFVGLRVEDCDRDGGVIGFLPKGCRARTK